MACSPANFWRPLANGRKMAQKRILLTFCHQNNALFNPFLVKDFYEIWTQNMNRCCHENFPNRISKFFVKGSFSPKHLIFSVFWCTHPACALQPWPLGLRWIWALHLVAEGPSVLVPLVTFFIMWEHRFLLRSILGKKQNTGSQGQMLHI